MSSVRVPNNHLPRSSWLTGVARPPLRSTRPPERPSSRRLNPRTGTVTPPPPAVQPATTTSGGLVTPSTTSKSDVSRGGRLRAAISPVLKPGDSDGGQLKSTAAIRTATAVWNATDFLDDEAAASGRPMPPEIELLHFGGVFAQHRQTQAQQCRQSLTGKPHENDDNDDDRTTAGYNSHEEVRADKSGKRRCDGGSHGADQGHAISSGPILCVPATPPRQVVDPTEKLDENWRCQKGDLNRQQHQQQSQRAYFAGPSDTPTRAKKRARHVNDGNNDGRGNLYILQHDDGLEHTPSRTRLLALGSQQQRWPRRRRLLSSSSPDSGGRCGSGAGESSGSEMIDTLHSYIRKKRQDTASLLRRLQEVEQGLREREVQIDRQQKQLTQSQQECAFLRQRVEQMQRADGGGGALCAGCGMAAW